MTVIVAIKCKDKGYVVAADGAATFTILPGVPGFETAKQPIPKLALIDDKVIFGHAGDVGLGQRLEGVIRDAWLTKHAWKKKTPEQAMQYLGKLFWQKVMKDENDKIEQASGKKFPQLMQQHLKNSTVVALPPLKNTDEPSIISFDWMCSPTLLTKDLPCDSFGSGKRIADPFLSHIRRVLWENDMPNTIGEGSFAAALVLKHVIEASPGYVGKPESMMIIHKPKNNDWVAVDFTDRLQEQFDMVEAFEEHQKDFRKRFMPPK